MGDYSRHFLPSVSELLNDSISLPPRAHTTHTGKIPLSKLDPASDDEFELLPSMSMTNYAAPPQPESGKIQHASVFGTQTGSPRFSTLLGRRKAPDSIAPPTPTMVELNSSRLNLSNASIDTDVSSPAFTSTSYSHEPRGPACWSPQSIGSSIPSSGMPRHRGHSQLAKPVCISPDASPEQIPRLASVPSQMTTKASRVHPPLGSFSTLALASPREKRRQSVSTPSSAASSITVERIQIVYQENSRLALVNHGLALKLEAAQDWLSHSTHELRCLDSEKYSLLATQHSLELSLAAICRENEVLASKLHE